MLCRYVSLGRFVTTVCQHGHGAIPAPLVESLVPCYAVPTSLVSWSSLVFRRMYPRPRATSSL